MTDLSWCDDISGYRFRTNRRKELVTSIKGYSAKTEYIQLWDDGRLILEKDYCWNGASGISIDTPSTRRGSAGHDALYQLIDLGVIPQDMRIAADRDLRRWCIEDGMPSFRADLWYTAVRAFGGAYVNG